MTDCTRRSLGIGLTLAMVLVVAATAFVVVGQRTGAWRVVPVVSGSMRPALPEGSVIVVTPKPTVAVGMGDIILFHPPTAFGSAAVVHRVTERVQGPDGIGYRTKGDANNAVDPWTISLTGARTWEVREVVPYAGYVATALRRPESLAVAALLNGAALVVLGRRRLSGGRGRRRAGRLRSRGSTAGLPAG